MGGVGLRVDPNNLCRGYDAEQKFWGEVPFSRKDVVICCTMNLMYAAAKSYMRANVFSPSKARHWQWVLYPIYHFCWYFRLILFGPRTRMEVPCDTMKGTAYVQGEAMPDGETLVDDICRKALVQTYRRWHGVLKLRGDAGFGCTVRNAQGLFLNACHLLYRDSGRRHASPDSAATVGVDRLEGGSAAGARAHTCSVHTEESAQAPGASTAAASGVSKEQKPAFPYDHLLPAAQLVIDWHSSPLSYQGMIDATRSSSFNPFRWWGAHEACFTLSSLLSAGTVEAMKPCPDSSLPCTLLYAAHVLSPACFIAAATGAHGAGTGQGLQLQPQAGQQVCKQTGEAAPAGAAVHTGLSMEQILPPYAAMDLPTEHAARPVLDDPAVVVHTGAFRPVLLLIPISIGEAPGCNRQQRLLQLADLMCTPLFAGAVGGRPGHSELILGVQFPPGYSKESLRTPNSLPSPPFQFLCLDPHVAQGTPTEPSRCACVIRQVELGGQQEQCGSDAAVCRTVALREYVASMAYPRTKKQFVRLNASDLDHSLVVALLVRHEEDMMCVLEGERFPELQPFLTVAESAPGRHRYVQSISSAGSWDMAYMSSGGPELEAGYGDAPVAGLTAHAGAGSATQRSPHVHGIIGRVRDTLASTLEGTLGVSSHLGLGMRGHRGPPAATHTGGGRGYTNIGKSPGGRTYVEKETVSTPVQTPAAGSEQASGEPPSLSLPPRAQDMS